MTYDVLIIGAGLAGLAAGELLHNQGCSFKIIEAESRVGGRVSTHHLPNGGHFELGPFSFGNEEQPLWDYVHRLSLPVIKHTPMECQCWFKGWKGPMNGKSCMINEQEIPLNQLMKHLRPELEKIVEDIPFSQALESVGASQEAIDWLQANTLSGLLGNGFQSLSTKSVLTFLQQYDSSSAFYALKGGNDQLPEALARPFKDNILFNTRIEKIEQLKDKCRIYGDSFTLEAKRVIFAIPLWAMKKIEFIPSLSVTKQDAIQSVLYTSCARISIVAPPAILNPHPRGGVFLFSDRFGWFREQTLFQKDPDVKTVFNVSLVGEQATKLSQLPKKECELFINEALIEFNPEWDPEQAEYHVSFWSEGYSCFQSHMEAVQSSLCQIEGRLHFAGEHTSKKYSSMNGAIESGIRVANEVLLRKD